MTQQATAALLPDGRRLHLHHGPIDIIIDGQGDGLTRAYKSAAQRFSTILTELSDELVQLRKPFDADRAFNGFVARRMKAAVAPFHPGFITPMAAVAGSVADEVLDHAVSGGGLDKLTVNNGGDIAFFLNGGESLTAAVAGLPENRLSVSVDDPWRGMATSGWGGRSHSLGIADTVTVLAINAALADAAATMIANAIDLPGHPSVRRTPARDLAVESDLGDRLVTTAVGDLRPDEIDQALASGEVLAQSLMDRQLIGAAILSLKNAVRIVQAPATGKSDHARLHAPQNADLHRGHRP